MKKTFVLIFSVALISVSTSTFAQSDILSKASTALNAANTASASGLNVSSLTKSIVEKSLTPKLSLTSDQTPKVSSAVSEFLTKKKAILPLLQTNKTAYTTQQTSLFSGLKTKLAGILLKQQMNKFLGLQSSSSSSSMPLSLLFK